MKSHTEKSPHQNSKIKLDIQTFSLRKLNDISIKKKLPLFVMFVIILAVVTTVGTTLLFFFNYSRNIAERNSNNALYGLQESLDRYKSGALNYAKIFAVQPNVVSAISEHNTGAVLSSLSHLVKLSDIDFVTVTDANGIVIARTHEPSNYGDSVTNQTNVAKALQGTPFAAIEKGTAVKLSARAGVPVKNGAGQIVGVISAGYRLDRPELVDAIKRTFKTDATIFLKDIRLDTTIKANGKRAVGTKLNPQIVQLVLKQNRKYVGNAMILGRPYLATYMPLLGPDNKPLGILFAGESMDEVIKTNVFIFTSVLIITVILILLIYLVAVKFLTISFIIPLQTAVDVLKKVAAGDLLVKISTEKTGGDEIGQLLTSLKTMVDNVRKLVNDIRELGESVAASAQEMMSSSEDVSKAAEHIAGSINDLAKGASTQAALTEKGNSDLQGVIEGLSEIKLKMNESEGLVNHALEAVNHGQKSVQNQESTMIANRKTTSQINLTIYNLSQMSTEIEEILGVIRGVAEQTNLLAINAAIEAARAKEQGRGFAVVAQQVKNLSEQSGTSVENISTIIHNLQANIARIVEEMNQLDSATEEQEKSIINTVNLFGNLTESVNTIANHITMVSQSANKLAHSAGHAGSSMEEIAGIAQATAANSEEVSASSEEQTAYFEQIAASAGQLADISSQLLAGIHRFSV